MKRWFIGITCGLLAGTALFSLMQQLITQTREPLEDTEDFQVVDFVDRPEPPPPPPEDKPPPPEPPEEPPPVAMDTAMSTAQAPEQSIDMDLGDLPALGSGPGFGDMGAGASELIPLQQFPPQYPHSAAMRGLEGWVKLSFTVTEEGRVANAQVVEAQPPNVFNRAALNAIRRWKFKAKMVNGIARSQNATMTLDFTLD